MMLTAAKPKKFRLTAKRYRRDRLIQNRISDKAAKALSSGDIN